MAYTFQQSSTDSISFTLPVSLWGSDAIGMVTGWYWMTTLADNATLWHAGTPANVARISDFPSASNLRISFDTSGTNAHFDFNSSLSSGKWIFVAVMLRSNGSALQDVILWVGDVNTPPQEYPDDGSPVGSSGSIVTGTTGQIGSNSFGYSFSGDAADVTFFVSKTDDVTNFFGQSPSTAFTTANKVMVLNEFVLPMWRGDYASALHPDKRRTAVVGVAEQDGFLVHMPLRNNTQSVGRLGTTLNGQGTNSGAVVSTTRTSPRNSPIDLYPPSDTRITNRRMR